MIRTTLLALALAGAALADPGTDGSRRAGWRGLRASTPRATAR